MPSSEQTTATVPIVDRRRVASAASVDYAMEELVTAVDGSGGTTTRVNHLTDVETDEFLIVGRRDEQVIEALLGDTVLEPEAVIFRHVDTDAGSAHIVSGSTDRGLMYALLELSERVAARGLDALTDIEETVETPDNEVRGAARFLMGPDEDSWFYDEDFWHYYLDRLARARFNRFVLITGFDTSFLSPPYPFFVDVPAFPDVTLSEQIDRSRTDHLRLLRRIADLCHQYGLEFIFGTWQQRPRTVNPDMDDDYIDQGLLIEELPIEDDERFTEYCARGLEELLVAAPEIDGVQLRVNFESGVGDRSTAEAFWKRLTAAPAAAAERRDRDLTLDIRAKGCTDTMIQWAQETGVDVTVSTKYWCESLGLPYHNTQMRRGELENLDDINRARRYSYSDLLRRPRTFDIMYRLWTVGSDRLFLWGDPEYARRFADSTSFGGATGFEILPPLSMKGGHYRIQDSWPLFDDPDLRHYEWEDERYWAWYLFFGRLGYSTDTDPEVWKREYRARFGAAADDILDAYSSASKILPLLTASHLTQHPTNHNWTELDTGGALFADNNYNPMFTEVTYSSAEPSDPALFYRIDDYVHDVLADDHAGKYTPLQLARWYDHLADAVRTAVQAATETVSNPSAEFEATVLDMRMLADLAAYHAAKTRAAVALTFYQRDGDTRDLQAAYAHMHTAVDSWRSLSDRGAGTYHENLLFAMGPDAAHEGTWSDRLEQELRPDLRELADRLAETDIPPSTEPPTDGRLAAVATGDTAAFPTALEVTVPDVHAAGEDLRVTALSSSLSDLDRVTLHYRHTNQLDGAFETERMAETVDGYTAVIPGAYLAPEWNLLVYVTAVDSNGNGVVAPGVFDAHEPAPYHEVEVR